MSLSRRQQEILDQIEQELHADDPHLRGMAAAFDRLSVRTRGADPKPSALAGGSITARRQFVLIAALLAAAVVVLVVGIRATSSDCPGLSSDQVVASASVRHAGCSDGTDAWSRGGR